MLRSKPSTSREAPIVSAVCEDGSIVETVHAVSSDPVRLCVYRDGSWRFQDALDVSGRRRRPYSAENNLIRHRVVLFPAEPAEYGSELELVARVQAFIHDHVDVSPLFEQIAAYYVLLTWVYDAFSELPYLRVRGDFGSGKSRFLMTVGSLCYKAIFASGASTVSPIFRILDEFQGTLVLDESDFRMSDEKADVIKILNNGNARGFPVLRSEVVNQREFNPRAYTVYGPKLIATRGSFADRALESRCITENLGHRQVRRDIPITLEDSFGSTALELRNQLLLYRFRHRASAAVTLRPMEPSIEPRLQQVYAPLLGVIGEQPVAAALLDMARDTSRQLVADRGMDAEAHVLEVLLGLVGEAPDNVSLRQVAAAFLQRFGEEYEWKVSSRWIGAIIRNTLQLKPRKSHGIYVLPASEYGKVRLLCERYGITRGEEGAVNSP